jgi:uroporphyrinogen-III synthase
VRTAAVGARTAAALRRHGASPPLVGDDAGADALWTQLRTADAWPGRRVLVATTPGGRRTLIEALTTAGAEVDAVETYRMEARPAAAIAANWAAAAPEAAVVGSPRVAEALVAALGATAFAGLRGVVAIGATTARALTIAGVAHVVADQADFRATARALAALRLAGAPR